MKVRKLDFSSWEMIIYAVLSTVIFSIAYVQGSVLLATIPFLLPIVLLIIEAPFLVFAGLFIAIPFSRHVSITAGLSTELLSEQLMWALCVMAFLTFLVKGSQWNIKYLVHPISLLLGLHLIWTAFTVLNSEMHLVSIKFLLSKMWFVIALFACGLYFFRVKRMWKWFFWLTYGSLTVLISIIMVKHAMEGFSFSTINFVISPFFSNHVYYAATIVLFIPMLFMAIQWYNKFSLRWWLIAAGIIVFPIAVYLSYTRAAIIVMAAFPFIYLLFRLRVVKWVFIVSLIGISVILGSLLNDKNYLHYAPNYSKTVYHDEFGNLIGATYQGRDISTMERVHRWVGAYHMVKEKPYLGFGPGTFPRAYKDYTLNMFSTYVSENKEKSGIHSYYFMVLSEQGIPGLIIFVALIYVILARGEKVYHRCKDTFSKNLLLSFLVSFVGVLMLNLINDLLEVDKVASYFFWTMVVLILVDFKALDQNFQTENPSA